MDDTTIGQQLESSVAQCAEPHVDGKRRALRIGVAVSGGIDSMVLLDCCAAWVAKRGVGLTVVHVNHKLRNAESEDHAAFVAQQAGSRGYEFVEVSLPIRPGGNLQQRARVVRLSLWKSLIEANGFAAVALGHNADDQLETFFMRLGRGSGAQALCGMQASNGGVIRPLLQFKRETLLHYAGQRGLSWVEDRSNRSDHYLRNRLRRQLIPTVRGLFPKVDKHLRTLQRICDEESEILQGELIRFLEQHSNVDQSGHALQLEPYRRQPTALRRRIIRQLTTELGCGQLEFAQCEEVDAALMDTRGSHCRPLGPGHQLQRDYDRALFQRRTGREGSEASIDSREWQIDLERLPQSIMLNNENSELHLWTSSSSDKGGGNTIQLACPEQRRPIILRRIKSGDRIRLPWSSRSTSMKRYFIDRRIGRYRRAGVLALVAPRRGWQADDEIMALLNDPTQPKGTLVAKDWQVRDKQSTCLNILYKGYSGETVE